MNNNNSNNRGNNNRRRGRGSSNRPQAGSPQQLNRIDSRARGNAPQMLEKYRKLAHDAHLNGDRVQEEYFLQFADHYFRVIADQRQRQEDLRTPRPGNERWPEGSEGEREAGDENSEYANDGEYAPYDRQNYDRSDREDRPREERPRDERPRFDRPREESAREDRPRFDRPRDDRPRDDRQSENRPAEAVQANDADEPADENITVFEPPVNPFVPEPRGTRGLRPRRNARPAQVDREDGGNGDDGEPRGLDPSMLPPAISAAITRVDDAGSDDEADAAPRRRTRRPRPPVDDAGEVIEVAG